jgi:hypothetical protein
MIFAKEIALFKSIEEMIPTIIMQSVKSNEFKILEYNRGQMLIGQDSKSRKIGMYSKKWALERKKRGLQIEHIDLAFSGKFQATLEIVTHSDSFEIKANVPYQDNIFDMFGKEVLGIQQEFLTDFVEEVLYFDIKKYINDTIAGFTN